MLKKYSIIKTILYVLGAICIAYGCIVVSLIGFSSWVNFFYGFVGIVLVVLALLFDKIIKIPKVVLIIAGLLIAIAVVNFTIFEVKLLTFNATPSDDAEYVIVLGCKVNANGPSVELSRRIDAASEFAKAHPNATIIATGGKGHDEPMEESTAIQLGLVSRGVPIDRILFELKSTSTKENLEYACDVVSKMGMGDLKKKNVVIVSSSFHLYRASKIAEGLGFEQLSYIGATGKKILLPQYYTREYGANVLQNIF